MSEGEKLEERAWLIEADPSVSVRPMWWGQPEEKGGCYWTPDSTKAIRFVRKEDAQAIIDDAGWTEATPTEHIWALPPTPKGEG